MPIRFLFLVIASLFFCVGCKDVGSSAAPENATDNKDAKSKTPDSSDDGALDANASVAKLKKLLGLKLDLTVGSRAPKLSIANWAKGSAVTSFDDGMVYVVEFWATWCPPCRDSMPHLSKLQKKHDGKVTIIGVTSEESAPVERFLQVQTAPGATWDKVIEYRLAVDSTQATSTDYMAAAQQSFIPTAFIVGKDGLIEWIGSPMGLDEPLEQIVAGDFDRDASKLAFETRTMSQQADRAIEEAQGNQEWEKAIQICELLIEVNPQDRKAQVQLASCLVLSGKEDKGLELLTKLAEESPDDINLNLNRVRLLQSLDRKDEAAAAIEARSEDSEFQDALAWNIAVGRFPGSLDIALKAATRAKDLTKEKDPSILDTLARVYAEQKNFEQAVHWQRKAAELDAKNFSSQLEEYEAKLKKTDE